MASTEVDTYWEPDSTENGIYSQMSQHKYQEIPPSSMATTLRLGSGEFGEVYRAELQTLHGSVDVALKVVKNGAPQEERVKLLQEAAILGQFRHKHIVRLVGVVTLGEQVRTDNVMTLSHTVHTCMALSIMCDPFQMQPTYVYKFTP